MKKQPEDNMPWKTLEWAYKLARSYVHWKDMMEMGPGNVEQTEIAYSWLVDCEELFRRQLEPGGAPCKDCPDMEG